jgi:DNA-directed RNA polymerase beta subunit
MNTAVRASYLTNHVKQAIGPVIRYPQLTCLPEHNVMIAPQMPIVRTSTYDFLKLHEQPYGHNVCVAFMQYKYNQEDAIILNKQSVEQGLLKIDSFSTKSHKIEKNEEVFELPPSIVRFMGNLDSYSKLDENTSLPATIGEKFYENDALIGKTTKTMYNISDSSVLNDKPDGVNLNSSTPRPLRCVVKNKYQGDNKVMKQCTFGQFRAPIRGDKFNSEHCQKGTCGTIMDPSELPYTTNGMRPDVIFNPPSIFKRNTYGQIYLPVIAKIAALLGCPIDCTPYHSIRSEEEIFELLTKLGLNDAGYETMYDPDTGRAYKSRIFFANHYWERQNHLVEQKINVRNGGPRDMITGIPTKGRKAHGGQSCERMTMDAQLSSGACETIRDIHLNQGASMNMVICKHCKCPFGYLHKELGNYMCPQCGTHSDFVVKRVPPASMMLMHIMNGLHCSVDYNE